MMGDMTLAGADDPAIHPGDAPRTGSATTEPNGATAVANGATTAQDRAANGHDAATTARDRAATGQDGATTDQGSTATGQDRAANGHDGATTATVATLRPGGEVDGVFACVRKDRLMTRTGSPYLAVELRDRTGTVRARAFRDADALAGRFDQGDLVRAAGRVERFRDELVLELLEIERAGTIDPTEFLPTAYRDLDELEGFLEHLAGEVHDRQYRTLLDRLIADRALRVAWRRAPCSRSGHHAYLGGLLEHTVAVTTLAYELCQLHPRLQSDLLITAAITHDLGRTREFTYGAEIGLTEEGRLLGHLVIGEQILSEHAGLLDESRRLALLHCVLAHHGPSTVPGGRFASPEAVALYRLNGLDASVKGAFEQGL
jgi:3'-5' exoribonuclease